MASEERHPEAPETVDGVPATEAGPAPEEVGRSIESWRGELGGQVSVSASDVQNRLLDLWGDLPDGEIRSSVETWLSETLDRSLYSVSDVFDRLDRLEDALGEAVSH